jgi:hypothetical protein
VLLFLIIYEVIDMKYLSLCVVLLCTIFLSESLALKTVIYKEVPAGTGSKKFSDFTLSCPFTGSTCKTTIIENMPFSDNDLPGGTILVIDVADIFNEVNEPGEEPFTTTSSPVGYTFESHEYVEITVWDGHSERVGMSFSLDGKTVDANGNVTLQVIFD